MNDKRFIELLNLYVDQELTDDEARALEQEIAQRPERRRIYTQYCRMQRACVRLFEQQTAPAPEVASLTAAAAAGTADDLVDFPVAVSEPVIVRGNRFTRSWPVWGTGLVAAAACVALVALRQVPVPGSTVVQPDVAAVQPALAAAPAMAAKAPAASEYRPVVVVDALLRPAADQIPSQPAGLAAIDASSLHWLQDMKLLPMHRVPFETLRFDNPGRIHALDQTAFANEQVVEPVATEITAFQFQR